MATEKQSVRAKGQAVVAFRSPSRRSGYAALPTVVLLDDALSDAAVRLYGMLVSYAHQSDGSIIYQQAIAEDLKRSVRAVQRSLAELADRRLVTVERQGLTQANVYWLEDAYALYDSKPPATARVVRGCSGDKNGVSDTTKMSLQDTTKMAYSGKKIEKETTSSTSDVAQEVKQASFSQRGRKAALVEEALTLTGDVKSKKRYEQLAGIVADAGLEDHWRAAYASTRAKIDRGGPLNAGAYFCSTLTKLLGEEGVYVPVGSKTERDEIKSQIAASLRHAEPEG